MEDDGGRAKRRRRKSWTGRVEEKIGEVGEGGAEVQAGRGRGQTQGGSDEGVEMKGGQGQSGET